MTEDLARLAEVQALDRRIAALERAIADFDDGTELARKIKATLRKVAALTEEHKALQAAQKEAEQTLWRIEQKLQDEKKRLESGKVTGHKAVQESQAHIESLQAQRGRADEAVLKAMDAAARAAAEIREHTERIEKAKPKLAKTVEKHKTETERLRAELSERETERALAAEAVSRQLLTRYEGIRRRVGTVGLVELFEPVCPECQTAVPELVYERLLTSSALQSCENCGRLFCRSDEE